MRPMELRTCSFATHPSWRVGIGELGAKPQTKKYEGGGKMKVRVGQKAPDFAAQAFVAGEGFKEVKLSDYGGQWVVLMFYPADFTFV